MKHFIKYFLSWVSQNLAVPFWIVGHIHLTWNVYHDVVEYGSSLIMNLLVGIGFYLDWKTYRNEINRDRK
jgi:DMSO/TMAO reductase YedYZ heme-binding membrane subunit